MVRDIKLDQVLFARNLTESLVAWWFIAHEYEIEKSTIYEDYSGIDLKVKNKKDGKITKIDVKCPNVSNAYSNNFLYTTISNNGKSYKEKITDYVIFIDVPNQELVFVSWNDLYELLKNKKEYQSKNSSVGKYVLLNKNVVKSKDNVIVKSYKYKND